MRRHSLLLRLVASGFELKMSLSCPKGHVDTCPTIQCLHNAIVSKLFKILFNTVACKDVGSLTSVFSDVKTILF